MAEDGAPGESTDGGASTDPLARLADESDYSREELLTRLLETPDRLASLEDRLEGLEDGVDTKIQDVRERVIQVKREADAKAAAEHDHPELLERLDRIADDLGEVRERLDALDTQVEDGFENYGTILEHLVDETDDLDGKLTTVATAVLDLRERADALAETAARRNAAATLAADANRQGVRRARCEDCGDPVDVGLLREPTCPHCDAQFSGVAATRGFFGSSTLETGTPPALEPADREEVFLDDLVGDREASSPGAFGDDAPDGGTTPEEWDWVGKE